MDLLDDTIQHMDSVIGKPPLFDKWLTDLKRYRMQTKSPSYRPFSKSELDTIESAAGYIFSFLYDIKRMDMKDHFDYDSLEWIAGELRKMAAENQRPPDVA